MKISEIINVVRPQYSFIKLTPNNSLRNNNTHKIARAIASLYRNLMQNVRTDEAKVVKAVGREFLLGTKYSLELAAKVGYYVYIERNKVEFYFVIPRQYLSLIKEKISDSWSGITVKEVSELPTFSESATQYSLEYAKEDALSLAVDRRDNDLLNSKLNVVDIMEEGDRVAVFYNFVPTSQFSWRSTYENTMRKLKRNMPTDRNKTGVAYALKLGFGILAGLLDDIGEVLGGKKAKADDSLERIVDRLNGGQQISESTRKKGAAVVLDTQIAVLSESSDKLRQRNNARAVTQSFETITDDNRLVAKPLRKAFKPTDYKIGGASVNKISDLEAQNFIAMPGRDVLERYNFIEKINTQETQVPEDLRKGVMNIGEVTYRGMKQPAYLSTDKEFKNLSLVLIGPNRAGKSTLIGNLTYDAIQAGECVIVFDYIRNCELSQEVADLIPVDKTLNIVCDDSRTLQGLGYNEIPPSADPFQRYVNAKKKTTQLTTLVNSINTDDTALSACMNRYLTSAALITFISEGNIKEVFEVLQNHNKRAGFLSEVPESQRENLEEYIGYLREINDHNNEGELVGTKLHLVEGIISRLNRLKDNPYLEQMLKRGTDNNVNLVEEMQRNQLICIKMPETMFSTDNERDLYATYWMTKIYLALQVRSEQIKDRNKLTKVNLVIDELYQVRNTERFLTEKLSRLPKFGIKPIISCHYLQQIYGIREELRSASASYMLVAGCDKKNYGELKEELYPFQVDDLLNMPRYHSLNLIKTKDGYGRFITKLPKPVSEGVKEDDRNDQTQVRHSEVPTVIR